MDYHKRHVLPTGQRLVSDLSRTVLIDEIKQGTMPLKQEERQAAYDKWSPVLGEIFDDLDKDKSGHASIDEMWYV